MNDSRDALWRTIELAWGLIANVSGGDWSQQSEEWQEAARRWRDHRWHRHLDVDGSVPDSV